MSDNKKRFRKKVANWFFPDNSDKRREWVKKELSKIEAGKSILDAGAGEQQYRVFCEHLKYVSQDFCQYDGTGNGQSMQTGTWDTTKIDIVGDIWDIDVADNSFDAVLCTEVFEHILYPNETIKEFSRILKSGGELLLSAPFCSLTHFAPYHYYTGFNKYYYQEMLQKNGFEIDSIEENGSYFEYILQEMHRLPSMAKEYSGGFLGPFYHLFVLVMAIKVKHFCRKDKGSAEVLCFGYHIKAHKK